MEKGNGSQNGKPMCFTFWKRHYTKCLADNSGCYCCGKDDKLRDCATIVSTRREGKQVVPNVPKDDASNKTNLLFGLILL